MTDLILGSILGGAAIDQAARYQQIILFLMSATNLLSVFSAVCLTSFTVCFDTSHRLRRERITDHKGFALFRGLAYVYGRVGTCIKDARMKKRPREQVLTPLTSITAV